MTARLLDGRLLAHELRKSLIQDARNFHDIQGRPAHLALIMAGSDAGATVFGQQVMKASRAIGVATSLTTFDADVSEGAVRARVAQASDDTTTDGVVVLLPLPGGMRQRIVTEVLSPAKDVDGLGPRNAGNLILGYPSFVPGTAEAVMAMLRHIGMPLRGKEVVVVGRSNYGGKPVAFQFLRADATVTICHSHTQDLAAITRRADILVVSVGRAQAITGEMVKEGAVVLDAGINVTAEGIVGDVDTSSVVQVAGWLTPTPGGLGPLTHLMVIKHVLNGPAE